MYLYVPRGVQTEIIKNSLLGLSLVIVDLMRRLISTIDCRLIFSYIAFFREYQVHLVRAVLR